MDELNVLDLTKPLRGWSSTPFIFQHCVCGIKIHAYSAYATLHDNFDPQTLTQSLQRLRPLRYPYTWYVYLRVAIVVNIHDLQAFHQIHPHHHSYQPVPRQSCGLEKLTKNQIYSYLKISRYHEEEKEEESEICEVCHAEFEKNEMIARLQLCEHRFHLECVMELLLSKNECPLCKRPAL
ncbi:hypothetical protein OSB04_025846 [Centaurea solstitialis]|uniref:RING-type E3 ubiquitin transferase n=1 Tax=Centaurea solstitialis TaxID=347529 RepID=A0AA38WDH1_9ASTR|nr:hypothetical protein OSB04_025846 [Centaurea solstitialis]